MSKQIYSSVELYAMYSDATAEVERHREAHKQDVARDSNARMTTEYHAAMERRTILAIAIANMITGVGRNDS